MELQGTVQRLGRERQEVVDQLQSEQRSMESLASTKEQTVHSLEQKVQVLNDELRRSLEAHRSAAVRSSAISEALSWE